MTERPYSALREEWRRAWIELRGSHASPRRLALAVALGAFVGSLPIFGFHTPIVLGLCLWFQLDGAFAWLASNVSNPFFAPALLTAEVELGAYVRRGALARLPHRIGMSDVGLVAGDLFAGAPFVALVVALAASIATWVLVSLLQSRGPRRERARYALPPNAPPWVVASEHVAARYADPYSPVPRERSRFHYVRTKLLGDPVAKMIADLEGQAPGALGRVVDVGSGRGQLAILLLELGRAASAVGFDWDERKVLEASRAAAVSPALAASFSQGDARAVELPEADTALLIDVLHYVDVAAQDELLDRAARAIGPNGRVVVREADTERGVRSVFTWLEERLFTFVRFNRGERVRFRPAREIVARLASHGLDCEVRPAWGITPFSNVLVVGRRRKA